MKLLFDHNLSHKLVKRLDDVFPSSTQTRLLGMGQAEDLTIWEYARENGFIVVTLDADFYDISGLYGHPPKLIWLRCGNTPTDQVERLLRINFEEIARFINDPLLASMEVA